MGRIKIIELSTAEKEALTIGYRQGKTHSYRQRCKGILLKGEGKQNSVIAQQLECNPATVSHWIKRYETEGIEGLSLRKGRGRHGILDDVDVDEVKKVVKKHRQKISLAVSELEEKLGRSLSKDTLKRYVKKTLDAINASENVRSKSLVRTFTNSR